jgi:NAD(P)-dependent dehydrogenase (short-subunit alcohol dehydrogenase family)
VVVNDLGGKPDGTGASASMADQVVKEIREAGGEAVANHDSVSTPASGAAIVQSALDHFGRVDIVINNAGILRDKTFVKLTPEELEIVLDVHLKGAFYVTQPAFAVMKQNGYGRIVLTASAAGVLGNFGQTNYAAAKMGLVGLSNVLAIEGAKNNIKSNVITPIANTRLTQDLLGPMAAKLAPEFVTPLVLYLASEGCELTHEIFTVGGGRYARFFVGMNEGWVKQGPPATVEEIAAHIGEIRDTTRYTIPNGVGDELRVTAQLFK